VDEELLNEIDKQFKLLDADGSGTLDWNDIPILQQQQQQQQQQ